MSKIFDPETGDINNLNESKNGNPFMRKILNKNNNDQTQKTEICISQKLLKYPQKNLVSIYDLQEPTQTSNGYIDMEILIPLEKESSKIVEIDDQLVDYLDSLNDDVSSALIQLHNLCIVYIDLHVGNVGWSKLNNCWKIFDFNLSGILNEENNTCQNTWKRQPYPAIYYNKISKKSPETLLAYDIEAQKMFDEEKNKLICKKCNILMKNDIILENDSNKIKYCSHCKNNKN